MTAIMRQFVRHCALCSLRQSLRCFAFFTPGAVSEANERVSRIKWPEVGEVAVIVCFFSAGGFGWWDRNPSAGARFFYAHHGATLEFNLEF